MPSRIYLEKLLEKAKQYLPSWLFREIVYYARAYAGGKARHNQLEKSQPDYSQVHHEGMVKITKPYKTEEELPAPVKKLPPKKRRQWMKAFNSAYQSSDGDEQYAFRVAWAAVRKDEGQSADVTIVKTDEERRLVYGIVYAPNVVDAQGDYTTAEEIEKAAHRFMVNLQSGNAFIDVEHSDVPVDAVVVESFIAPTDFCYPGSSIMVPRGSWVAVTHIRDEELWKMVKSELVGYSMAGYGKRVR
jgi:cation transport regulator ChaB